MTFKDDEHALREAWANGWRPKGFIMCEEGPIVRVSYVNSSSKDIVLTIGGHPGHRVTVETETVKDLREKYTKE